VGLEAALYARHLGYAVTVYERGKVAEHVQRWGHIRLFSPFGMNTTSLGRKALSGHSLPADGDCITGGEHRSAYLEPLAKCDLLKGCIQTDTRVLTIGRSGHLKSDPPGDANRGQSPFRLLIRQDKSERVDEADVVLDCTGTFGKHRWLGDGGIPAIGELTAEPNIPYGLEDVLGTRKDHYAGKSILVVGGGYSAATTVCALATLAEKHLDTWVVWLARTHRTQPLPRIPNDPLKDRDRLAVRANTLATRGDGNVEFHSQSLIHAVEKTNEIFKVRAVVAGQERTWDVDRLIANVGYQPDVDLYRELQIHECYASQGPMALAASLAKQSGSDCLAIATGGTSTLRNPEPNFHILGAKSYGRNSHFLLRAGFDQVRDVFALITGKPGLDLYKGR
jgi:hypothetical protein